MDACLDSYEKALGELVKQIELGTVKNKEGLESYKREVARKFHLSRYPSNSEIIQLLKRSNIPHEPFVRNPRRSSSGIVVATLFTSPYPCPHGTCIFCPGGPRFGTPQSYLENSPGVKFAMMNKFDPYIQICSCLQKYEDNGHDTSKVEVVIEGGTFLALPENYAYNFVKGMYEGLNRKFSTSLEDAITENENSERRCVGLTVETKPDWCKREHVDRMLTYGVTRVEIGVQSLQDEVLKFCNRGHTVEDVKEAIQCARDSGLKICVHMMPGLPKSDPNTDLRDLISLFHDKDYMPDMMKIYPTLVIEGTALERMYRKKLYKPYDDETVIEMLSEMKKHVPRWHRIMRIQREIPAYEIKAGVKYGNLRELILQRAREKGYPCKCIRCREVSLKTPDELFKDDELSLRVEKYNASGGKEFFVSYEFNKSGLIAGFGRLRLPSGKAHRSEVKDACIVRELRVYGRVVSIGKRNNLAWQHMGIGRSILQKMEDITRDLGIRKIVVISAVGTRNYYRRMGYSNDGPYVSKILN